MLRLTFDASLIDVLPLGSTANIDARILRNGIAISVFALLEGYVSDIFERLASQLNGATLNYNNLPDDLRHFLTIDAIKGLSNKIGIVDRSSRLSFAELHMPRIASFSHNPPQYTSFGFSPAGSNVSHEDIKNAFRAFQVTDPWRKLANICSAMGSSRVDLQNDYKTISQTRHRAAHDAGANVPSGDLQTNIRNAILIGIAVDVLTSIVGDAVVTSTIGSEIGNSVSAAAHDFRFLDEQPDGTILERPALMSRAVKRYDNRQDAIAGAGLRRLRAFLIIRDSSGPVALA